MKIVIAFLLMLVSALAMPTVSRAQPGTIAAIETFSDPAQEARARNLQRQLRCLVCQGESVDESNSDFAADIRHLVRQQITSGKSDPQILDFLVERYGDFILMKPPLQSDTWLLWLAPFLVLGAGGAVAWTVVKKAAAREA
jgi:cytochrome c-type biogenesis protein CcmH